MNIAAAIILYHPDENWFQNTRAFKSKIEKLYIIDNTESNPTLFKNYTPAFENLTYLHDGKNKGISLRLNEVSKQAIKEGYDWLLTMDQDSSFDEEMLNKYFKCIKCFKEKEKVSMFGVSYTKEVFKKGDCNPIALNHLITSGSVLNLKSIEEIGYFDEKLFIDEVDFEYCLRSVFKGFQIIQFANIFLTHNLGETSYHRSFKNIKLTSRALHSPLRIYYMTRNFLYVKSKYRKTFPEEINLRRKILLNRLKNNILYNKKRYQVIKYILRALEDFKGKRMGKII